MEVSNLCVNGKNYVLKDKEGRNLIDKITETANSALDNSSTAIETANSALSNSSTAVETANSALSNSSAAVEMANSKSKVVIENKSVEIVLEGGVGYADLGVQTANTYLLNNGSTYKGIAQIVGKNAILNNRYLRVQCEEYPTATFVCNYLKITLS